ncbi:transglutaminase-like domain-containing protein [Methanosphaera sp.]|uniref:transglutaminase-like domain-containing protein n=1 Tax=Methanosphaera sp. TaxID=2666342 RepID=UPI0025E16E3B|nr:transglutaminase-like domain-containing protein [Methanosphaera sp.]
MVLLVSILFSISALAAADTDADSSAINDANYQDIDDYSITKSVTNIESNSIENKVSNEYETITNVSSPSSENTITKQSLTNNTNVKSADSTTTKREVSINSNSITAYSGNTINIKANVSYKNGEKLNYAKVSIKLNGKTIIHTTVSDGSFSTNYVVPNYSAKTYPLEIIVGETSTSLTGRKNVSLTIKRHDLSVSMSKITATSASSVTLKAEVKYKNGSSANGQKAVFKINGKTVLSTTVVNGVASGSYIVPTKASTYSLLVKIGETTTTSYEEVTSSLIVTKRTPTIVKDSLVFVQKGSNVYLNAKITGTGYANASGKVSFKVNGKTVATVNVINNTAECRYKADLKYGYHVIDIVYGGSSGLNSVRTNTSLRVQADPVATYTYSQVLEKANSTHNFVLNNKRLPNFVTMSGNQVSMTDLLYMFAQALSYNNSYHNGGFSSPTSYVQTTKYDFELEKDDYVSMAYRLVDFYKTNGRAPNVMLATSGVNLNFNDTIYTLAKALSFTKNNNRLPNYVTVLTISGSSSSSSSSDNSGSSSSSGSSSGSSSSSSSSSYSPTNSVPSGYEKYLASAKNSYVNYTVIKNAVQKAVSGVSGTYNQAVAIFNYVNKVTDYSFYMNTRRGAIKTLQDGLGNCVDQSHLLLGMYRTANIPARYCHATCYFRSGLVVGHVWVECYVNGKWYSCDTTSNQNTFNNIVNWGSCSTINRYTEIYF